MSTFLLPRYAFLVAIIAHTMRAILLATATSLRGLRSNKANSQVEALFLPGLAKRITVVAPAPATVVTARCRPG